MKETHYDRLFREYLDVCNRALNANKEIFPYKQLWDAANGLAPEQGIRLAIYDDRPKGCYHLRLTDRELKASKEENTAETGDAWRVNLSYLERVVNNPDEYINHPAKLDWDWLRNRLGL